MKTYKRRQYGSHRYSLAREISKAFPDISEESLTAMMLMVATFEGTISITRGRHTIVIKDYRLAGVGIA